MIESPPSRAGCRDVRAFACPTSLSPLAAVFSVLVVLQIVSRTDQAAMATVGVVRVVRVDVPPVVRSYDAKPDASEPAAPPLLLGCTYALEGGENDDENGGTVTTTTTAPAATTTAAAAASAWTPTANASAGRGERSVADPAADAAMEEVQHQRGLVVKWYFRRDPSPAAAAPGDPMAIIDDSVQVYQWLAGGGPEAGGGLGPLSGRVVDVTAETPRANKSLLHRVIRVERPTAELTGEYRCQVEDWHAERRSAWHPMVVYKPERIFKISVDDNDDDDEHDITEGSGGETNSTTQIPSTTSSDSVPSSSGGSKQWPTEINITCYAAGVHPEPSMSIWVNGVVQESVTMVVTDDDGDDDETNDDDNATSTTAAPTTTTTTTTTAKPKVRSRFRGGNRGDEGVVYKDYAVRASKVVSLKEVEEHRTGVYKQPRRRNAVEVECRLRVPGDGHRQPDRPGDHYYGARRFVAYKYRGDSSDAYAAVSSASSMDDDVAAQESANGAGPSPARPAAAGTLLLVGAAVVVLQSAAVAVLGCGRQ